MVKMKEAALVVFQVHMYSSTCVCTYIAILAAVGAVSFLCSTTPPHPPPQVMNHIETNRDAFEPYMEDDESFDDYLGRMRGDAEWGGHQELVAASQLYKVRVVEADRFSSLIRLAHGVVTSISCGEFAGVGLVRLSWVCAIPVP